MVDKIIKNRDSSLTVIYSHKQPFTVSGNEPLELLAWLTTQTVVRLDDWRKAVNSANEETGDINLQEAA